MNYLVLGILLLPHQKKKKELNCTDSGGVVGH